ncbi:TIGR04211 family SH3 domain-containing protein [Marinobacter persicus]|uniref:SH3 domain protein n=1 Tax=Marinobacter persicus TaxID=930118 RepID=A0A2S6G2E4_9GAMM|nr:TIGR04211 family SH3 domain-containing protein [Marinobacter persicus]KXS52702.1 MAG: SH3 domain protein [Marinobacter sp. T13-3]PPK50093.1 SH3 domain protein [Marinobacter persicus]PPK51730.1 SH3 domain protein [Marinobacter persicus]PPK56284.1 SH3 domain protein [Marinobacter persicus]
MSPSRLIVALLLIVSSISVAQARTVWVDDQIYLPLRSGAGTQYRIVQNAMPSGTPLEVLETGSEYSRVRSPQGNEGWVANQYLSNEPIAADQLKEARQQLQNARERADELSSELAKVTEQRNELQSAENNLSSRTEQLQAELTRIKNVAADSLNLERRNQELVQENQRLTNELEVLTAENARLESSRESDFMLLGAGLVFGGVLLALIIPMLKPSRKTDNWA